MKYGKITGALMLGSFLMQPLLANQPMGANVDITARFTSNGGLIHLGNNDPTPITLVLMASADSSIKFTSKRVQLDAGAQLNVDLGVIVYPQGLQVFHLESRAYDGTQNLPTGPGPSLYQPVMVDAGGGITPMTYEDAFLSQRVPVGGDSERPVIDLGGAQDISPIGALAFLTGDGSVAQAVTPLVPQYTPFDLARMPLGQLPAVGSPSSGTPLGYRPTVVEPQQAADVQNINGPVPAGTAGFSSRVQGRFLLKQPGNTYQAAWGWVVRVWQNIGSWHFVGWAYVDGNGYWAVSYAPGSVLPGLQVRIEYRTANRFVQLQDANANVYTWGDNWTVGGGVTDIGTRSANFSLNGNLPGVDKLYVGATNEWVKMHDNGINPLRDQPIQVTFPNTLASGFCQQGSPVYAWSCSYWSDGRIYIIPQHANASVVQHEIAHSVNSYFWGGNLPPGAGGQHNFSSCYNAGLALSEGFADFISYWVQFDRTAATPVLVPFGSINIETPPAGTCAGQTNEMRVAATFWDTYDVPNDGTGDKADALYYVNRGDPVALYLGNPNNQMLDYLGVMWAGQSAYWQTQFTRLYRFNTILP